MPRRRRRKAEGAEAIVKAGPTPVEKIKDKREKAEAAVVPAPAAVMALSPAALAVPVPVIDTTPAPKGVQGGIREAAVVPAPAALPAPVSATPIAKGVVESGKAAALSDRVPANPPEPVRCGVEFSERLRGIEWYKCTHPTRFHFFLISYDEREYRKLEGPGEVFWQQDPRTDSWVKCDDLTHLGLLIALDSFRESGKSFIMKPNFPWVNSPFADRETSVQRSVLDSSPQDSPREDIERWPPTQRAAPGQSQPAALLEGQLPGGPGGPVAPVVAHAAAAGPLPSPAELSPQPVPAALPSPDVPLNDPLQILRGLAELRIADKPYIHTANRFAKERLITIGDNPPITLDKIFGGATPTIVRATLAALSCYAFRSGKITLGSPELEVTPQACINGISGAIALSSKVRKIIDAKKLEPRRTYRNIVLDDLKSSGNSDPSSELVTAFVECATAQASPRGNAFIQKLELTLNTAQCYDLLITHIYRDVGLGASAQMIVDKYLDPIIQAKAAAECRGKPGAAGKGRASSSLPSAGSCRGEWTVEALYPTMTTLVGSEVHVVPPIPIQGTGAKLALTALTRALRVESQRSMASVIPVLHYGHWLFFVSNNGQWHHIDSENKVLPGDLSKSLKGADILTVHSDEGPIQVHSDSCGEVGMCRTANLLGAVLPPQHNWGLWLSDVAALRLGVGSGARQSYSPPLLVATFSTEAVVDPDVSLALVPLAPIENVRADASGSLLQVYEMLLRYRPGITFEQMLAYLSDPKAFNKHLAVLVHPDRSKSEADYSMLQNARDFIASGALENNKPATATTMVSVQMFLYQANLLMLVARVGVKAAKGIKDPTVPNAIDLLLSSTSLFSVLVPITKFSMATTFVALIPVAFVYQQHGFTEALTHAATFGLFMLLPMALGAIWAPLSPIASSVLIAWNGYHLALEIQALFSDGTKLLEPRPDYKNVSNEPNASEALFEYINHSPPFEDFSVTLAGELPE